MQPLETRLQFRSSLILLLTCVAGLSMITPAAAAETTTLGFVVRDWFTSVFNSKFLDECPEGLVIANDELWWRGLSKEERAKQTENGLIQNLARQFSTPRRAVNARNRKADAAHRCVSECNRQASP